jgi:hypothetical protein
MSYSITTRISNNLIAVNFDPTTGHDPDHILNPDNLNMICRNCNLVTAKISKQCKVILENNTLTGICNLCWPVLCTNLKANPNLSYMAHKICVIKNISPEDQKLITYENITEKLNLPNDPKYNHIAENKDDKIWNNYYTPDLKLQIANIVKQKFFDSKSPKWIELKNQIINNYEQSKKDFDVCTEIETKLGSIPEIFLEKFSEIKKIYNENLKKYNIYLKIVDDLISVSFNKKCSILIEAIKSEHLSDYKKKNKWYNTFAIYRFEQLWGTHNTVYVYENKKFIKVSFEEELLFC